MVEDRRPSGTGARLSGTGARRWPIAVLLGLLAGVCAALAVEFHWLGWTSIPGGSCGGRYGSACPDGTGPTLLLAFLFTFAGLPLIVTSLGLWLPFRRGLLIAPALICVGAALAVWPGYQAYLWMRGPVLDVAWDTPHDRPKSVQGKGVWVRADGTVIRAKDDALVAYDPGDGSRRWTVKAPVRKSVCAMSRSAPDGVGVVAYHRHGKPCDTVAGIDLDSGRTLWEKPFDGTTRFTNASDGLVAADGGTAVAVTEDGVRAFGLRDGEPRWTHRIGDDQRPFLTDAAGGRVRVVTENGTDGSAAPEARLVTLDAESGDEVGAEPLPVESGVESVWVVAAEPFTLWLKEEDDRGIDAFLVFPAQGGDPLVVDRTSDDEDLVAEPGLGLFPARPPLLATVRGDTLIAASQKPGEDYPTAVSAYSLKDGERLWRTGVGDSVHAMVPFGTDRLGVLTQEGRVWNLDARTGAKDSDAGVPIRDENGSFGRYPQLVAEGDGDWLVVNNDGDEFPPVIGLTRG
ncbi:PQQ-binding-like beta-propeller repeat protein [Streptomyces sp. NPDC091292]|uniref:outer membrane protein assembly factor BamB family protein n=1 Tax=Streptomyces sp. NPDC091292 TaxID=3365991 RepID=UPI003817A389